MLKKLLIAAPLLALMSCASLNEDSCRAGDWEGIGYNDGTNGRLLTYLGEHREACSEYGITPNSTSWLRGRLEGLKQYCTPANVYDVGRRGRDLSPVCSPAQASELRLAHLYGMRYYEIEREIDKLDDELDEVLFRLETEFNEVITPEQADLRRYLLRQVRELQRDIRDLERDLRDYDDLP